MNARMMQKSSLKSNLYDEILVTSILLSIEYSLQMLRCNILCKCFIRRLTIDDIKALAPLDTEKLPYGLQEQYIQVSKCHLSCDFLSVILFSLVALGSK